MGGTSGNVTVKRTVLFLGSCEEPQYTKVSGLDMYNTKTIDSIFGPTEAAFSTCHQDSSHPRRRSGLQNPPFFTSEDTRFDRLTE